MTRPIASQSGKEDDWTDLEAIFLGRTVHIHSLSPFFLPDDHESSLKEADLESFAAQLKSYLILHLDQQQIIPASSGVKSTSDNSSNLVRHVRAAFLSSPTLASRGTPKPFVVEIEINQPSPTLTDPDRKRIEKAHLVFFSTASRQSDTHYPLLLWKAPLSARVAPQDGLSQQQQEEQVGNTGGIQPSLSARMLTSYILHFIAAFFDCRLSTLAPLHGIRGKNLEDLIEAVTTHCRRNQQGAISRMPVELTFALPRRVRQSDAQRDEEAAEGPAPDLNTISLSIPATVTEELMRGSASRTPIMPAVRHYLSTHTSIHLSQLTLTRAGVGSVFVGAPTSVVTPSGRTSSGEVRLKISRDWQGGPQGDLINVVLRQLIRIAEEESW